MKTILSISLLLMLATVSVARPVAYWPYEKLKNDADLIVVATPIKTEETGKKRNLPGITRGNEAIAALDINTTFTVLTVLKGNQKLKSFVLLHLREENSPEVQMNAPMLVTFNPNEKKRYLLFLKQDPDGRFTPLCGQTDPAGAIKYLGTYP